MFRQLQHAVFVMVMLLAALIVPATAQAQQQAWLPSFDASTHVYVDPALENNRTYPVDFRGMEREVKDLQKKHGLEVFIVAVERDYDINNSNLVIARDVVDDLIPRWSSRSGFPGNDFMVVVWVRNSGNPNKGSVAAYAGPKMASYGYDRARLSDKVNGPVTPALKQFMPANPHQALLQVVRNANDGIDRVIAQREQDVRNAEANERARIENERLAAERAERDRVENERRILEDAENAKQMQMYAAVGIPSVLVIGLFVFLFFRLRNAKAKAAAAIKEAEEKFEKSNANYIELETEFKSFLRAQGTDWKTKFKNKTLKRYTEAVGFWANLSAQNEVAKELIASAKTELAKANIFSIAGAVKALALLTTEQAIVTGDKIPVEDRDYYGSEVSETPLLPEQLFASMADLFSKTGQALKSIRDSFRGAEKNRGEIEAITKAVDELRASIKDKGLDFGPYEVRYQKIKADQKAFLDILASDPLSAFSDSETVEHEAEELKADIEHALKLKDQLTGTEAELTKARKRAEDVRAQAVGYAYPEKADVPDGAAQKFLLNEAGANPNAKLDEAAQHLADAHKALLAADLKKAETEKAYSSAASAAAIAVVETVLAAKAAVEKSVPGVRSNLARLTGELPASQKDVDALKSGYLAKNFVGEPEKLVRAKKVSDETAAELDKVRIAYFEQRFVAARSLMEGAGRDVQNSRNGLVEIASRLKKLGELKDHARSVVKVCDEQTVPALRAKLEVNSFTTSKQTDSAFAAQLPVLRNQKADVAKDITDWPLAAEQADKLAAELKKVDGAIDSEKRDHQVAGERIEQVRQAVNTASQYVNHPDVRSPARQKLDDSNRVLAELDANYRIAKSDWQDLARKAESKKTVADEARRLAETDRSLAQSARNELGEVESHVRSIEVRSWVQTASWGGYSRVLTINIVVDLSEAKRWLGTASSQIRNRDYEDARRSVQNAESAADRAEQWANAQLALAVQEQIREWQRIEAEKERQRQEEERRRREEEDRRRREEDDRRRREEEDRRRNDNNNGGGGGWTPPSGGGNVGTPNSGGDNY